MSNVIDLASKEKEKNDKMVDSIHEENFSKLTEGFDPHNLEMIKRGIKSGLSMLEKAIETNEVANVPTSIQKTLVNLEELVSMLEHDLIGMIKNIESQAAGAWTTQAHLQTLIETLKIKSVVTDDELKATWDTTITPMMKEMQEQDQS
jgi:hypothetical protein